MIPDLKKLPNLAQNKITVEAEVNLLIWNMFIY